MSGTPSTIEVVEDIDGNYINFQAAVLRQLPRPRDIDPTTCKGWVDNQEALRSFLLGLAPPKTQADKKRSDSKKSTSHPLILIAKTDLPALPEKPTSNCLCGDIYGYRDADINRWLPRKQLAQAPCSVSAYQLQEEMTFKEMAERVLGTRGTVEELGKLLKERGHTTTLTHTEALIERQESGENVGLRDGWANLFFVENEKGSVSVVYAGRRGARWDVHVSRLDSGFRWDAGSPLFVRNSDTAAL